MAENKDFLTEIIAERTARNPEPCNRGEVAAYFADRATLTFLLRKEKQAAGLLMAETYLSVEPIALALRRGDPDFRLAVDTALSHIYRRGEITTIFKMAFGALSTPVTPPPTCRTCSPGGHERRCRSR